MTFKLALTQFAEKAGAQADLVIRKVALDITSRVVDRSPVDTGRFRANWTLQIGAIDYTTTQAVDPGGEATASRLASALPKTVTGTVIYIANSLPYAWRLETGYSKQAPAGMVGLTVAEYASIVDRAAA